MNCESPIFRDCVVTKEGNAPSSKDLIKDEHAYIIEFKYNGNNPIEYKINSLDSGQLEISLFLGTEELILDTVLSKATIPSNKIPDPQKNVRIRWFNHNTIKDKLLGPTKQLSACTIKFEDARPRQ